MTYWKNVVWVRRIGPLHYRPENPSHCICKINEWTWICLSPNIPLSRRANPESKQADWPAKSTLQHQWRDGEEQKGGGRTDFSGNRLDNRHKHWEPVLCTGTHWLVEGPKSPAQENFPSAALQPRVSLALQSRAAAGIWLELWRCDLGFPCSRRADWHCQEEAGGPQRSSYAAPTLVRNWMRQE